MPQLLIIGGSDAGISAALRAREVDPSWNVRLVVADRFPNFSICGLPFYLSGETPRWESLAHRTRPEIERRGIELLLDAVAERIDPAGHTVNVREADGAAREFAYDRLVVATGATPARPPIRGLETPSVYDPELGRRVQTELERHGVQVRLGVPIEGIERADDGVAVSDREGNRLQADLVIVATGVRPSSELARRVDAVEDLDLSYTPPLSSPWDPVQTSCMDWTGSHLEGRP